KFKGENSKVTAAKEKKAATQAVKDSKKRAEQEAKDSAAWAVGSKKNDKKAEQEAKRLEKLARKQEADALLAAENKSIASSLKGKTGPAKLGPAKPVRPARGAEKKAEAKSAAVHSAAEASKPVESFAARNIDDALDLMSSIGDEPVATGGAQAKKGGVAALVDRHPERRAKAAYKAFEDRELDRLKSENPGLRLTQLKQLLWKEWQKSPDNPFNQVMIEQNATAEEINRVIEEQRQNMQDRLRIE
ncbi:hypothetical protein EC988_000249, partial [Linderina pennispora]